MEEVLYIKEFNNYYMNKLSLHLTSLSLHLQKNCKTHDEKNGKNRLKTHNPPKVPNLDSISLHFTSLSLHFTSFLVRVLGLLSLHFTSLLLRSEVRGVKIKPLNQNLEKVNNGK